MQEHLMSSICVLGALGTDFLFATVFNWATYNFPLFFPFSPSTYSLTLRPGFPALVHYSLISYFFFIFTFPHSSLQTKKQTIPQKFRFYQGLSMIAPTQTILIILYYVMERHCQHSSTHRKYRLPTWNWNWFSKAVYLSQAFYALDLCMRAT